MTGQHIKDSINRAKEFLQLWLKFNLLYKDALGQASTPDESEKTFLELKSLIARKLQALAEEVTIDRFTVDRAYEVINQILSLRNLNELPDTMQKKIETDWHECYISFNRLLGRLEARSEISDSAQRPGIRMWVDLIRYVTYIGVILLFLLVILFLLYILGILK